MKKYALVIAAGIALVAAAIPAKAAPVANADGVQHHSPLDANAHMRGHGRHYGWHRGWHRGWYHHRRGWYHHHRGWRHHHRY